MAKYLVHCDGCGKPTTIEDPMHFSCTECQYPFCTVDIAPEPKIGRVMADELESVIKEKYQYPF